MIVRKLESVVLREMRIKKKPDELRPEQRKDLQRFCSKWEDVFSDLYMLKEKPFGQFIDDALKGKSDKQIKDWYFNEIANREQLLSQNAENKETLKQELRSLSLRAFGFCGMHFHTIEI